MAIITVIFGGLLSWGLAAFALAAGFVLSQAILAFFVTNICVLALGLTAAYRRPHNVA